MKKRLIAGLFCILLVLSLAVPSIAREDDGSNNTHERIQDMAGLLTGEQCIELAQQLDEISDRQQTDVTVITTNSLEGKTITAYADDMYDTCYFGYGNNRDGLMLVISMEDRDWYISTCGAAITAFTDAGIQYIGQQMTPYLSDGKYAKAFDLYADLCDKFLTQAKTDTPYDNGNLPKKPLPLFWIPVSIAIGLVLALIITAIMIGQLKTVRAQVGANDYMKQNSLRITQQRDLFLYRNVTKTPRPKENNSSSGSSTHTSSSGTTHGGGGGKF